MMEKFRKRMVNIVLTTNLLARGIDIPEMVLVINFDVPKIGYKGLYKPDYETYLHRIGRAGRFGMKALALSIYDNEEDEQFLHKIVENYGMQAKLNKLDGPDHLKKLIEDFVTA